MTKSSARASICIYIENCKGFRIARSFWLLALAGAGVAAAAQPVQDGQQQARELLAGSRFSTGDASHSRRQSPINRTDIEQRSPTAARLIDAALRCSLRVPNHFG
jgi:hypothetical protein